MKNDIYRPNSEKILFLLQGLMFYSFFDNRLL